MYELWDTETGNCIGAYVSEGLALSDVREDVRRLGTESYASVALLHCDPETEKVTRVAFGDELIQRAEEE